MLLGEERREKRDLRRMRVGRRKGGRWRKGRLDFPRDGIVRMQWQGQGTDRAAILEETQGRGLGERWGEKGQGREVEGREDTAERQAKRWGDRESVGEQGRGEEVGNVTGASGWGAGRWPVACGLSPLSLRGGSKQELQGHPASLGCWESCECGGRGHCPQLRQGTSSPHWRRETGWAPRQALSVPLTPHRDLHPLLTPTPTQEWR